MAVPPGSASRMHATLLFPLAGAALLAAAPAVVRAQGEVGAVGGRVTEAGSGSPIAGASVRVLTLDTRATAGAATSGDDGRYRVGSLRPGAYAISVSRIGYQLRRIDTVRVTAGGTATVDASLEAAASVLNQVVTTATRGAEPEKILESPNSISVVSAERIAERPAVTVTDHLKASPGLSISSGGIAQANIVSRGFNNAFSTSMLMLQDYRFAGVPSLRVNVPFLFTGTNEDVDRIEVLQGPAAALYGPNSGNGVLHVITKSPFASAGTTLSVDGGERSYGRLAGRHAGVISPKVAYKLSGEYFTAKDFEYTDPNEPSTFSTTDVRVPAARRGTAVQRDFDLQKASGEARLDIRPNEDTEFITTAGYSKVGSGMEITTTFGASQVRDWSYLNLQQRFRHKKFFAQLFYNNSNSGNENAQDVGGTYYLRTGIPVVDKSSVFVGQLQQGFELGRTRFVVGGEFIGTRPATEGTINGRNDGDDDINEAGGYLQTTTALTPKLDLLLAARGDVNSRIEGAQFSPRAALILKATPTQNFRVTFNRAFNSPASFNFFLDQFSGTTPAPGLPVQIMGNPAKQGWQFDRSCGGPANVCMRSPYTNQALTPASAATAYPGFAAALPTIVRGLPASSFGAGGETARQQLLGLLTQLGPILTSLRPTDAQVGSVLLDLNTRAPISAVPGDYAPLGANFSNTFEAGYKGLFADKFRVAADFWFQRRPADPTSQILNPGVLFNPQQLGGYLGTQIATRLIAAGTPAAQAQATATAAAGALTPLMAAIPVGATAFTNPLYDQSYLVFSYQNAAGYVNVQGVDLASDLLLNQNWSLAGTYSWLSDNLFPDAPGATALNPLAANTPTHRATLTVRYEGSDRALTGEVRGRYANAFQVNSGVFNSFGIGAGQQRYPGVPVNAFLDASVSYKLPIAQDVRISLSGTNLLDNERPTFVGVAPMGRLLVSRLQYSF
ncbi:TonB-dependent receptor [Roseisolibacter sp. H3M3-2]|uniref:TonB-dependent receptor n=1 Tax=Roseisolibacter sp. H3M3-2 TaxID=3031323 RepID=UPI0023DCBF26|nr:TonB-dependent receptor [Roseisolibacter sp. H3M3-2]